jgi:hypothetical protein
LRIKEEETRLTLREHDDDDDDLSGLITMRNISDKFVEKFETRIFGYIIFLNRAFYEIM